MPFHTDSQFEAGDISEVIPPTEKQLVLLQKQYGGTYAGIIGQLIHIFVWTQPNLGFFYTQQARYSSPKCNRFSRTSSRPLLLRHVFLLSNCLPLQDE